MAIWKVVFLLIVVAVRIQNVACRPNPLLLHMETTPAEPVQSSSPLPPPQSMDPCQNHTVSCNPASSLGSKILIWVSAGISFSLFFFPIGRIIGLQPGRRADSTLFWWFLCLGSASCAVWWCYFSACFFLGASVLPILVANIIGALLNAALTIVAVSRTTALGDSRLYFSFIVPAACFAFAYGMKRSVPVEYTGWFGLALTGLSQSFRVASSLSSYRGNFNRWQFSASVLGAVGGCLWTIHPQLCVSREYKITSYAIAIIRGTEVIIWCSSAIAWQLGRLEGQNELPPEDLELQPLV